MDSLIWAMKHEQPQVAVLWAVSNFDPSFRGSTDQPSKTLGGEDQWMISSELRFLRDSPESHQLEERSGAQKAKKPGGRQRLAGLVGVPSEALDQYTQHHDPWINRSHYPMENVESAGKLRCKTLESSNFGGFNPHF